VAPGARGAPAKFKLAEKALAEHAYHARAQKILAARRGLLDARVTDDYDNPSWKKFKGLWWREQGANKSGVFTATSGAEWRRCASVFCSP